MGKTLTLLMGILFYTDLYCQTVSPELISSDGSSLYQNGSFSLCYAVGETIIETDEGSDFILTQGFLQSDTILITSRKKLELKSLSYYPNPFSEAFYINVKSTATLSVYSMTGQCVKRQSELTEGLNQISAGQIAPGLYNVRIVHMNGDVINFRIEKLN